MVTLEVLTEATHIPEFFEVSIEGKPAGTQILAKNVKLPSGTELAGDPDALVVNITGQITEEQMEAELAEAEAEAGIEHDETDAEAAQAAPAEAAE
jgi:large subunit ribosomal protein L25